MLQLGRLRWFDCSDVIHVCFDMLVCGTRDTHPLPHTDITHYLCHHMPNMMQVTAPTLTDMPSSATTQPSSTTHQEADSALESLMESLKGLPSLSLQDMSPPTFKDLTTFKALTDTGSTLAECEVRTGACCSLGLLPRVQSQNMHFWC